MSIEIFFLANSGDQDEMPHQADVLSGSSCSLSDKLPIETGKWKISELFHRFQNYRSQQKVMDFLKPQMSHHMRFFCQFQIYVFDMGLRFGTNRIVHKIFLQSAMLAFRTRKEV